jgi:putative tryptophan/tyrosine transport system substrate-binding protein
MKRWLTALFFAALTTTAQAQTQARVGFIAYSDAEAVAPFLEAFLKGMSEAGYVEGRNLQIFARYADERREHIEPLVRELVGEKLGLIVAVGPATRDAIRVAGSTPVVFGFSGDPIVAGWASSLATPTENATGVTFMSVDLNGKRIELLHQALPSMRRLAVIANPLHPGESLEGDECRAAAARLGLSLTYLFARNAEEVDVALRTVAAEQPDALIALPDALTMAHRQQIIDFAGARRIPVISGWARFAESGALLTYGPNLPSSWARLAYYADRILRGAKPQSLPIEQPSRFELVVNLATASRLGIELPQSLLTRADQVIE